MAMVVDLTVRTLESDGWVEANLIASTAKVREFAEQFSKSTELPASWQ